MKEFIVDVSFLRRRIDPWTRSWAILGSLFAIGFVIIVIVVLSLIPLYLSHSSWRSSTYVQVSSQWIYSLRTSRTVSIP